MTDQGPSQTQPLHGVTVIEVDSWMAAPSAGVILADMGADVIKIEPPGGDPMRGKGRPAKVEGAGKGFDFQFDVSNRGKRSVTLDLTNPAAVATIHRLVGDADIFMCNLLTDRQQRYRLDPESLLEVNPKLVHATLTGYGTTGPEADRPGFDVTAFFARSGLSDASREGPDGVLPMARTAQGDHTAGLALVGAILAALRIVERGGPGQVVETSLYETAIWTQASDYAITAVDRAPVRRRTRQDQILVTNNRYCCGDGRWVVFTMPLEKAWEPFARTLGLEHLIDDDRFATGRDRYHNMAELVDLIDEAMATRTRDEWGQLFDTNGLIWGPVLSLDEVVSDIQAEHRGLFPTMNHPEVGEYPTVANPIRSATAHIAPRGPAPEAGNDTDQVLTAAGLSADEIAELRASGALG